MLIVASSQYSFWFDKQVYFPYSIAILVSYLKTNKHLTDNLVFLKTAIHRDKVEEYVEENDPDVLLCSCYSWNWEITNYLAKKVKEKNPNCIVIFGGPQTPRNCTQFFKDHNYVDAVVHNEGEVALQNIMLNIVNNKSINGLKSVSTPNHPKWKPEKLIENLDDIPSPYINNLVFDLVDTTEDVTWITMWETSRGCPYKCSYCAYGVAAYNTTRKFSIDRLYKEIDWISSQHIDYVDCVDANFGIYQRDADIVDYLVKTKSETGSPDTFRTCWAKKITPRVMYIARELKESGLLTAMGCSLQSLNNETLDINNRKSVSFEQFNEIINEFKSNGAQTYTEIIRGLPGETLESFKYGLNKVVFESDVDTVYIYNCLSIKNTILNSEKFINDHKIVLQKIPMYFPHIIPFSDPFTEYDEIIVQSDTYTKEDLIEMHTYSWYIMTFQVLGIVSWITRYLNKEYDISHDLFFNNFMKYCKTNEKTLLGREYKKAREYIENAYNGESWFHIDNKLGNINWPIDEATWIRISDGHIELGSELEKMINIFIDLDDKIIDLIKFQLFTISNKNNKLENIRVSCKYDWLSYFNNEKLENSNITYSWKNKIMKWKNNLDWNTQAIWYGRRKVNYKANLNDLQILNKK